MADNNNFRIKNGLEVGDVTVIDSSRNFTAAQSIKVNDIAPSNSIPAINDVELSGYGLIGNRTNIYITNANSTGSGKIVLGIGDGHNANPKLTVTASGIIVAGTISSSTISADNFVTTGQLRGPATFVIDPAAHGDDTGTVVIAGNLQIDGLTTTINSTTLTVDDKNIVLASGSINAAAANAAGITVDGANAKLTYNSTDDSWDINKRTKIQGPSLGATLGNTATLLSVDGQRGHIDFKEVRTANQTDWNSSTYKLQHRIDTTEMGSIDFVVDASYGRHIDIVTQGFNSRFTANGRLGIGTTSPSEKLDVNGSVKIRETGSGNGLLLHTNSGITMNSNLFQLWTAQPDGFSFHANAIGDGSSEKVRITGAGNVGIGTSSPQHEVDLTKSLTTINQNPTLQVKNSWNAEGNNIGFDNKAIGLFSAGADTVITKIQSRYDSGANVGQIGTQTSHDFLFTTGNTERMRIDGSGNLLVGTTSTSAAVDGFRAYSSGQTVTTTNGAPAQYLNRRTSDGEIVVFRKDNATVGSIGTEGGRLVLGTGNTGLGFIDVGQDRIIPRLSGGGNANDSIDLGDGSSQFKDLYLAGTANVSTQVRLKKQGTADVNNQEYDSASLVFEASAWDTNGSVARDVNWTVINETTASIYPDSDLKFYEPDNGLVFELHGRGTSGHVDPKAGTFYGNVEINAGSGTNAGAGALTVAGETRTGDWFQVNSSSSLLKVNISAWSTHAVQDVLKNGYNSTIGDYLTVKASGNGAADHGAIVISDNVFAYGQTEKAAETAASTTAPFTSNAFQVTKDGNANFAGTATMGGLSVSAATGTASPTPTTAYISTQSSGSDWSTTSPWGRLAFYSGDGSGTGPKPHVVLDATASNGIGASSSFSVSTTSESTNTLTKRLNITNGGDISFYEDTGTTAKMVWDASAESLGIGTSTPQTTLHLLSNTGAVLRFERNDASVGTNDSFGSLEFRQQDASDQGAGIVSKIESINESNFSGAGGLAFSTGNATTNTERMRIDSSGNVGISTSSPRAKLNVQGTTASTYSGNGPGATIQASQGAAGNWIASEHNGAFAYFGIDTNRGKYAAYNYATNTEMDMILGQDRIYIKSNGNVGIGTTDPKAGFQVMGPATATVPAAGSGTVGGAIFSADLNTYGMFIGSITSGVGYIQQQRTNTATYYGLALQPNGGGVGIGTSSPNYPLDVSASIGSTIGQTSTYNYGSNRNWAMRTNNYGSSNWGGWSLEQSTSNGGTPSVARIGVHLNGNVGINMGGDASSGLTDKNPATALHVGGDITVGSADSVGTGGTSAIRFVNDNERSRITSNYASGGGGQMGFWTDTTGGTLLQRMTISNAGNVGIGASTPNTRLQIASSGANAYSSTLTKGGNHSGLTLVQSNNANDMVGVMFGTGTDTNGTHWSGITGSRSNSASHWGTQLNFYTHNNDLSTITGATQKMVITGDGNVGIGTTNFVTTGAKLQVKGTSAVPATNGSNFTGSIFSVEGTSTVNISMGTTGASGYYGWIQSHDAGTGTNYKLSLNPLGGNVGIGTDAPGDKLTIEGAGAQVLSIYSSDTGSQSSAKTFINLYGENTAAEKKLQAQIASAPGHNASSAGELHFSTNNSSSAITRRMTIREDGNVGIGTTTPQGELSVSNNGAEGIEFFPANQSGLNTTQHYNRSGTAYVINKIIASEHRFNIGGNEKVRINTLGQLLVNKTASNTGTAGVELQSGTGAYSAIVATATAQALLLNKLSAAGSIAVFRKDNTNAGQINVHGTATDSYISMGNKGAGLQYVSYQQSQYIRPFNVLSNLANDNSLDLGQSSARFDDVYATNGTIQTSDRNEKQDIEELSDAETRVAVACKGLLRKFRWKDSVDEKGDEARTHFGIIAQDLQDAFSSEGLDASDYAMFISTTWTDEETDEEMTRLGVRYSELLAFIIAAL